MCIIMGRIKIVLSMALIILGKEKQKEFTMIVKYDSELISNINLNIMYS